MTLHSSLFFFFFFNDTATTEIYTLSLHDALPILLAFRLAAARRPSAQEMGVLREAFSSYLKDYKSDPRSEEHTSELQSLAYLVCRLLLEKKKQTGSRDLRRTIPRRLLTRRPVQAL